MEKSKKKIYAFTLSPDNVKKLEDRIGYGSRSKIIDILISDFVDNRNSLSLTTRQTRTKKTPGKGLYNV